MKANAYKLYKAYLVSGNKIAAADMLKKYPDFAESVEVVEDIEEKPKKNKKGA